MNDVSIIGPSVKARRSLQMPRKCTVRHPYQCLIQMLLYSKRLRTLTHRATLSALSSILSQEFHGDMVVQQRHGCGDIARARRKWHASEHRLFHSTGNLDDLRAF